MESNARTETDRPRFTCIEGGEAVDENVELPASLRLNSRDRLALAEAHRHILALTMRPGLSGGGRTLLRWLAGLLQTAMRARP